MKSMLVLATELPPGPGGIGTHAYQVALQLAGRGWQVALLAPQDYATKSEVSAWKQRQPMPITTLRHAPTPVLQGALWALSLLRAVRRHRPRVLLVSGQRAVWLAATLRPLLGVPFVAVGHGVEFGARGRLTRWLNRRSYGSAAAVVAVSGYTRRRMLDSGVEPRRSEVIANGADAGTFHQLAGDALDAFRSRDPVTQPDRRLLITVGRVGRRKGQDLVVRTLPRLLESHPDLHYVLIGLPDRGADIEALAAELEVSGRVHVLGRQPTDLVRAHLSAADLFVMPSRHTDDGDFEGYGIAVVEAALCGLPAVVAGNSGLAEAVEDGETGVVVPPDDEAALFEALESLLSDQELRRRLGEQARERALAEKTWRRRVAAYDRLLHEVAGLEGEPADRPGAGDPVPTDYRAAGTGAAKRTSTDSGAAES